MAQIRMTLHRHVYGLLGLFLCLMPVPLAAQVGPVPGAQPQISYTGTLRRLDGQSVVLKLDDGRLLRMNRTGKTKFYRDSKPIKASDFGAGDHVLVDATGDQWGFLFALRMTLEKAATPEERAQAAAAAAERPAASSSPAPDFGAPEGRPSLKRKEPAKAGNEAPAETEAAPAGVSESQPSGESPPTSAPPPPPPPELKRRTPSENPSRGSSPERAETQPVPPALTAPVSRSDYPRPEDALIEKARQAAFAFSDKLPNFICQEYMARYARYSNRSGWEPLDIVSTEILYADGQETYRNLKINDRPTDKQMEELSGAWSTGEFASTLNGLFHPQTNARFRDGGENNLAGRHARVYDFAVEPENSHWVVQAGSESLTSAYQGSVWIDTETARVLRVEIQARNLPSGFPLDVVESAVDYSWVRIAGEAVLLPVHAESLGCHRGARTCNRNIIDFRNYRKYTADSKITFDEDNGK